MSVAKKQATPKKKEVIKPENEVNNDINNTDVNPPPAPKKPTRKINIATKDDPESPSQTAPAPIKKITPRSPSITAGKQPNCIMTKYREAGWIITEAPKGTINQYIAHNSLNKYHFIQCYEEGNAKHEELPRNQFIQNAMSNGAIPVYATCKDGKTVTLQDINTQSRIIIKKVAT